MPYLYRNYVQTASGRFKSLLDSIAGVYGFDYGDEFEIVLCQALRLVLPQKYGVCRGHVVRADGALEGDDVIIFDQMRFPTLQFRGPGEFGRKEHVPIEAVYAYIEAKHTLVLEGGGRGSLAHAMQQAGRVRALCQTRLEIPRVPVREHWPRTVNPIYTGIVSRRVKQAANHNHYLEDSHLIYQLLQGMRIGEPSPDLVIAGSRNVMMPAHPQGEAVDAPGIIHCPFHTHPETRQYVYEVEDDIAFGVGISALLWALDSLELGDMNLLGIIGDGLRIPFVH